MLSIYLSIYPSLDSLSLSRSTTVAHCDTGSTHEGGKTFRYEWKIIDWDVLHARIQEFLPGGGVQARLPENSIFLVLNLFYSFTMVYFKQNYNFPRFQRGSNIFQGGPTFSRGEMLYRGRVLTNVVITCDPTPLLYIFGNKICLN